METKINSEEVQVLAKLLSQIYIKQRTGEVGIIHGMSRFVSTSFILKKTEQESLNKLVKKIGLTKGINKL